MWGLYSTMLLITSNTWGGRLRLGEVRGVETYALIDAEAAFSILPEDIVAELAPPTLSEYPAEAAEGVGKVGLAANVIIMMEDRIAQSPSLQGQ
jgi:hypothetical protein